MKLIYSWCVDGAFFVDVDDADDADDVKEIIRRDVEDADVEDADGVWDVDEVDVDEVDVYEVDVDDVRDVKEVGNVWICYVDEVRNWSWWPFVETRIPGFVVGKTLKLTRHLIAGPGRMMEKG